MKKKWIVMPLVLVVVVFAWVVSMAGDRVDPTGVMQRLLEMEETHTEAVQSFLGNLKLDYHPAYGVVQKDMMPCHASEWSKDFVAELFPNAQIVSVDSITKATFSGTVLTGHKDKNGQVFYVWHHYQDEVGVLVTAQVKDSQEPRTAMAVFNGGNPIYLSSNDLKCRIAGHLVAMRMIKW